VKGARWVTRLSSAGRPYDVWEGVPMPRIPDELLQSVFYLYPSTDAALKSRQAGGTAFLVEVVSEETGEKHCYAVSNVHVVKNGCNIGRLNARDGGFELFEIPSAAWESHPEGDDIAVAAFRPQGAEELVMEPIQFLDLFGEPDGVSFDARMGELNVGVGDDAFMVGRFVSHDGKLRNQPLVRFGNIAMMPDQDEPVMDGRGLLVEACLVEMHSLPGFSGSPVFLSIPPGSYRQNKTMMPFYQDTVALLGIDTGHKMLPLQVKDTKTRKVLEVDWYAVQNTGVAIVSPVWKIRDVLYGEEFMKQRKNSESSVPAVHDEFFATSDLAVEDATFTRDDFMGDLHLVTRQVDESAPEG
jgi:hypothetical protein